MSSLDAPARSSVDVSGAAIPFRALAVLSFVALTASYMNVLYTVTNVVGGVGWLVFVFAATLVVATVLARSVSTRVAIGLSGLLLILGLWAYFMAVPSVYLAIVTLGNLLEDLIALLTGLSVLRMADAGTWALSVTPAPVFLSWYFLLRRRYVRSATVGVAMLAFFVLTGDAGTGITLVGVLGAAAMVGFGTLEQHGGTWKQVDVLVVVLVVMLVVSMSVSVVPGRSSTPLAPGGGSAPTVEQSLVNTDDRVSIRGSIRLSPKVRFTVAANSASYWRTAAYDRYTGGDWIRTGGSRRYSGSLAPPPGGMTSVRQTVRAETQLNALPAAWRPVRVTSDIKNRVRVTNMGSLRLRDQLSAGETYTVESLIPEYTAQQLRETEANYPQHIRQRFLQLPESTPGRVERRTNNITEDADNPYDEAVAIEQWLEENKGYSLDVERPEGDVADKFLFEMDEGYCVYFATAMVAMLRTQDIPSRFVVGYTSGQQVNDDQWVVRGLDSHAWVEVYFPETGWVRFDPTPAGSREDAEIGSIEQARAANVSGIDTNESEEEPLTPKPDVTTTSEPRNTTAPDIARRIGNTDDGPQTTTASTTTSTATQTATETDDEEAGGWTPTLPPTEQLLFGLTVLSGLLAAAHRSGAIARARRELWLRWQLSRTTPQEDVERAFRRLEYLLGRQRRQRKPGETPREYLTDLAADGLDERVRRVAALYERARYAGDVTESEADEAIATVDALVRDRRSPFD